MHKITVIGTSDRLCEIKNQAGSKIVLRTDISKAAQILKECKVDYLTLDSVYDKAQDFDELDSLLADEVIKMAKDSAVTYIVPGSAVAGDGSVKEIASRCDNLKIIWGDAPEYTMLAQLTNVDTSSGYTVIPAACLEEGMFAPRLPLILTAVDNKYLLSDLKLMLSQEYGDEHHVFIGKGASYVKMKLYEVDRAQDVDHNTMIYIPPKTTSSRYDSFELERVFEKLRAPGGCPWDREQTHESLKRYLLEECAEVLEAIDNNDMHELMDELGDVLLQVLFHATIASERGDFSMRDVEDNLARKLIRRHPHVFAQSDAKTPDEVLEQWDAIKHDEKEDKSLTGKLMSVPKSMTALMRAQKVLSRAAKTELIDDELLDAKSMFKSLEQSVNALGCDIYDESTDKSAQLIGAILFNVAGLARLLGIEGEIELSKKTNEYIDKYREKEDFRP